MKDEDIKQAAKIVEEYEPTGRIGQMVKGVKLAFATKKAVMAAYALLFGVAATGGGVVATQFVEGNGMTPAQVQQQEVLQETIIKLEERVIQLQEVIENMPEHDHPVVAPVLIPHTHDVPAHEHESVEHSHSFQEHSHPVEEHEHNFAPVLLEQPSHDHSHEHPEYEQYKAEDLDRLIENRVKELLKNHTHRFEQVIN